MTDPRTRAELLGIAGSILDGARVPRRTVVVVAVADLDSGERAVARKANADEREPRTVEE